MVDALETVQRGYVIGDRADLDVHIAKLERTTRARTAR